MDIQVASNFERLLYDLYGRDGAAVARLLASSAQQEPACPTMRSAARASCSMPRGSTRTTTAATMAEVLRTTGELVDPHTAVGIRAGRAAGSIRKPPLVALATAHPAKFPDAVRGDRHPPPRCRSASPISRAPGALRRAAERSGRGAAPHQELVMETA